MPDDVVVIASSPFETQGARDLINWTHSRLNPRKIVAINTHFHSDGTGGNEAYVEAGAEIWANELTLKLHKAKGQLMRKEVAESFSDLSLRWHRFDSC